ncbi:MAG: Imm43 family immunity protein [Fluviicola sp.]
MKYYILTNDWQYDILLDEKIPDAYDEISMNLGTPLESLPSIDFIVKKREIPDSIPNHQLLLVFSERIREIINKYETRIQYFEINVLNEKKEFITSKQFKLVNLLHIVDAIDYDKSELDIEDGDIFSIDCLILKDNFNFLPIFRLNGFKTLVLVREDLAQEMVNSNCTGIEFYEANGFRI